MPSSRDQTTPPYKKREEMLVKLKAEKLLAMFIHIPSIAT